MIQTKKQGNLEYLTADNISAPHCFTTRYGGVSEGYLSSLNLGIHRGDKPENVRKNYDANDHKQQSVYIMNTDNVDTASRSIRADGNGIGVSMSGAKGTYKPVINLATGMMYFGGCSWNLSNDVVYIQMNSGKSTGEFYVNGSTAVGDTLSNHSQRIQYIEDYLGI